ncbi:bifunctional phosphopantothenoylcysteine decarboxylase/phosphopantothenate--cysteine ligase CoaBC [Jeotgalibacillus salarius]|uniref:bifunctional phosphopantothenoylcysteine decarboxylase/phosphopantothenate--cysteine ligase CoaBC n=1 Tax=Jeotgalibacillus salarius TaxID=546023 RepID=UPI001FC84737|nr:bifunctional phosphopantothenoylcysteine decarboxylase/phosphopantothenate--cysteine ligase CoaBC [Jeotgalibacillus salarius]
MVNKNILLCVSGGIAVYKAVALTSKLSQAGFNVKVIMTESAMEFVTPLTFQAMSRNDVYYDTFDEKDSSKIAHIDLADWADLVLIAPATANVLGKLAHGIADDMITTTLLATTAPVWAAPAMNVHMYSHPAVLQNIDILDKRGVRFVEPSEGFLACGYVGKGRLEEPEKITDIIINFFDKKDIQLLKGKKLLVTAGPTREKIDPVRFFTNHSSGKMGYAIAKKAAEAGAEVTLVSGPVSITPPFGVTTIKVETAEEMYGQVMKYFDGADVVIKSAAVADYRPAQTSDLKMKKKDGSLMLEFERTTDILRTLGEQKSHQILIGFAAETDHLEKYAEQKLKSKNADLIVGNNIMTEGAGFGSDTNVVSFFRKDGTVAELPMQSKEQVAEALISEIDQLIKGRIT